MREIATYQFVGEQSRVDAWKARGGIFAVNITAKDKLHCMSVENTRCVVNDIATDQSGDNKMLAGSDGTNPSKLLSNKYLRS